MGIEKLQFIESILNNFRINNPDKVVPDNIVESVKKAQGEMSVFESGAGRKLEIWRRFDDFMVYGTMNGFNNAEELNKAAHDYINALPPVPDLQESELAQYTIENYFKNTKASFRKFIKGYRKEPHESGLKNMIKSFREYRSELNAGGFKEFLHTEYPKEAANLKSSIVDAKLAAEHFDIEMSKALGDKAKLIDFNIKKAQNLEKEIFSSHIGEKVARVARIALPILGIAVTAAVFGYIHKKLNEENKEALQYTYTTSKPQTVPKDCTVTDNETAANEQEAIRDSIPENTANTTQDAEQQILTQSVPEQSVQNIKAQNVLPYIMTIPEQNAVGKAPYEPLSPFPYNIEYNTTIGELKSDGVTDAKKVKTTKDATDIAEKRANFEQAVNKIKSSLSFEGLQAGSYTVVKGDSFWKIAEKTLKQEGISSPSSKEIIKRIALIAVLNDIEKVTEYTLYTDDNLIVPTSEILSYIESNAGLNNILEMLSTECV